MASNQEGRHAAVRAITSTARDHNADWSALFDQENIPSGDWNGRFLNWINGRLSTSFTNLPGAMAAYAVAKGFRTWNDVNTIDGAAMSYVRPADWLTMPVLGSTDEKFVGLYGVWDNSSNYLALSAAGNYTVDWGDGTVENFSSGVTAEHLYTFSSLSSSTLTTYGFRQALVVVTPQAGQQLTSISLQKKHSRTGLSKYTPMWLDVSVNGTNLTSVVIGANSTTINMYALRIATIGATSVTNFSYFFSDCRALASVSANTAAGTNFSYMFFNCYVLQTIPLLNTAAGTDFSYMFRNCYALQTIPLLNIAAGTNFSNMFQYCYALQTIPLLNTAAGTNFTYMFQYCYALQTIPLLNTAAGTNFSYMFNTCYALQTIPLLNTAAGTNFSYMFTYCYALQTIPLLNTAAGTDFSNMFQSCYALGSGAMSGARYAISYSGAKLARADIVAIYNGLGTASGSQTITVSGNHGYVDLTGADNNIAIGKGWTIG
jgi:hypothetical protein